MARMLPCTFFNKKLLTGFIVILVVSMILSSTPSVSCLAEEPIIRADGSVDTRKFNLEWRKYSDIDNKIPLESRSWEAQQYQACLDEIKEAQLETANLEARMELDREARLAMRDYQDALVKGLKGNLLKSFWRLSWITYNTVGGPTGKTGMIKAGKDLGGIINDYRLDKLITTSSKVAAFGKSLAVVKKTLPKQYSKLPGDSGKVINVGVDAVLEGVKNADQDPAKLVVSVVTKVIETAANEALPSADITDEEINILRNQNNELQLVKHALEENYAINQERQNRIDILKQQINDAQKRAREWEEREKSRVLAKLVLSSNQTKPIHVTLAGPQRLKLGEVVTLTATVHGGSGDYTYAWVGGKPAADGAPAPGAAQAGNSVVRYRAGAAGQHLITVVVTDKGGANYSGLASILIDVGDYPSQSPIAAPAQSQPSAVDSQPPVPAAQTQPLPRPNTGSVRLVETLIVGFNNNRDNPVWSKPLEKGKTYVFEASGIMKITVPKPINLTPTYKTDTYLQDPVWQMLPNGTPNWQNDFLRWADYESFKVKADGQSFYVLKKPDSYNAEHFYRSIRWSGYGQRLGFFCRWPFVDMTGTGAFTVYIYEQAPKY